MPTSAFSTSAFSALRIVIIVLLGSSALAQTATVTPLPAPATPFPSESQSAGISQFSFIVYGDTRSRHDGIFIQPDHLMVVEGALDAITRLKTTPYPVRFALFSGDAVVDGRNVLQWNKSFVDVASRLVRDGNIPFFMSAGNHDVTSGSTVDAPGRADGLKNFLDLNAALIPAAGTPRRLAGFPTYAFGFGNTFFIALDSNIAADQTQFAWVKGQLEGLNRTRYANVVVYFHHPVFSSGPHGGVVVEQSTAVLRTLYMPLFNTHHVSALFAGHEHLFEHWVERYQDASGAHRMDMVVTGGGGAPPYSYQGEPETRTFNLANHASMEHLVKPGMTPGENPYHFVIVRVDGNRLAMEVVGVDWGRTFRPYRSSMVEFADR